MTFTPIHCEGLLKARAAAWRGEYLVFDFACVESVNSTGLLPFILEDATENVRKWAIRLVPFAPVDECIRLAGRIMNHPEEGAQICNSIDLETYCTMRLFLATFDGRN
jgi:hypothetical protein